MIYWDLVDGVIDVGATGELNTPLKHPDKEVIRVRYYQHSSVNRNPSALGIYYLLSWNLQ